MQHEYTAQQLDHAMGASHDITGDDDILEVSFEGIRAVLEALPDQPGDDALREQAGLYKELIDHPFFKDWSISGTSVRSFMMNKLDSAMTPQDDWEACAFEDIQKGDRVKREDSSLVGDAIQTTEGTVVAIDYNWAFSQGGSDLARASDDTDVDVHLYRIPAPVVHPDPAEHLVILVHDTTRRVSLGGLTGIYQGDGCYGIYHSPDDIWGYLPADEITLWEPAEVVARVVADE